MSSSAIRFAARRTGGRAWQQAQAEAAVEKMQQRLMRGGKPIYPHHSNPGSGRSSNAKVLERFSHRQRKMVEYTMNAASFGLTHIVLIALFGNPYTRNEINPSPES